MNFIRLRQCQERFKKLDWEIKVKRDQYEIDKQNMSYDDQVKTVNELRHLLAQYSKLSDLLKIGAYL